MSSKVADRRRLAWTRSAWFSVEVSGLLLLPVFAIVAMRLAAGVAGPLHGEALFVCPPLTAAAILTFVLATFRGLAPRPRVVWPLNVTAPTMYVALLAFSVMMWTSTGNSVVRPPEIVLALSIWSRPFTLIFLWLAQVGVLSMVVGIERARAK